MQQLRHPAPAVCRGTGNGAGQGAGGGVAVRGPAAGPEPAPEPSAPQNNALYWSFPGSALDVTLSRRWLAAAVEQAWGAGDDADRVVLAYSEVATNAVVHGTGPVTVSARIRAGAVTCQVADCSVRVPQHRHAAGEDVCGRGLDLVEMTVDWFGVDVGEAGKTVSFEVGRTGRGLHTDVAGSGRSPLPRSGRSPVGTARETVHKSEHDSEHDSEHESVPEPEAEKGPGPGSPSGTGPDQGAVGGSAGGSTDGNSPGALGSPPAQGVGDG